MKDLKSIVGMCLMEVHEKGEEAVKIICNCSIPSRVMLIEYDRLETKLDDLPTDEKEAMWQHVHKTFPYKNQIERLNVCKIIHTIATLL